MDQETVKDEASGQPEAPASGQESVLEFNFVPSWARKPPEQINYYVSKNSRDRDYSDERPRDGRDRPRGGGQGKFKKPLRDRDGRQDPRQPPRGPAPESRPGERPTAYGRDDRRQSRISMERVPRAPVHVRFVPEQGRLSAVVRQIHVSQKSYPLVELASLFLSRPDTCEVRIEVRQDSEATIFQCRACKMVSLDKSFVLNHIAKAHLADYFTIEETLAEPPTGQFVCVAKCGLSGELLGPPNHHSYSARIHQVHQARYADMNIEQYKSRIQMVHDPLVIEKWKEDSRKQTVYHRKQKEGEPGPAMKLADAEAFLLKEVAPTLIQESRRAVLPATVARGIEDRSLLFAVRDAWQKENGFPLTLTIAFRGAFRHRRLHIFKAGKGIDFVSSIEPSPLDPERTVEPIKAVLTYLRDNPGCNRDKLVEALRPGLAPNDPEIKNVLTPLAWLIERGHLIEFFNGTLAVPLRGVQRAQAPAKPAAEVKP